MVVAALPRLSCNCSTLLALPDSSRRVTSDEWSGLSTCGRADHGAGLLTVVGGGGSGSPITSVSLPRSGSEAGVQPTC